MVQIMRKKHILLVVDAFFSNASGARVAHQIVRVLLSSDLAVTVLERGPRDVNLPDDLQFAQNLEVIRLRMHKIPSFFHIIFDQDSRHFSQILDKIKPDVVHLCSFNYGKSRFMVSEAKKRGIRVVTQYFRYELYCGRMGYSALNGKPCEKCNGGNAWHAFKNQCGSSVTRPVEVLSRYLIWKFTNPLVDAALSTCTHMDEVLVQAGISKDRIVRCPLPYDISQLKGLESVDGDHFFFSGAFLEEKGAHLLEPIISEVDDARFVFLFLTPAEKKQQFETFKARAARLYGDRVYIDDKMRWGTGGSDFARKCRGALQPTVWHTSTEYTLLEMLGLGKAVVAFNVGMHKDYLSHEKNALVYDIGDHKGFIDGVRRLNRDPDLRSFLGQNAKRLFDELTDQNVLKEALMKAYRL
jgi:glycosyltransferase involved in cell wall biosynthesis